MSVKRAFNDREQFFNSTGDPLTGGQLFFYVGGSSTKQNTFTDSTGATPNANPIILDATGRPTTEIWLTTGVTYKIVLAPAIDTDPPLTPIWTEDFISGINDTSTAVSEWLAGPIPTYISATSFTLVGDQTSVFTPGRALKIVDAGGTKYGFIKTSVFTTLTTVVLDQNSAALASPTSSVSYGIVSSINSSAPILPDTIPIRTGSADESKQYRLEVDGFTTATTIIGTPAPYAHRIGNLPAGIGPLPYAGASIPVGWLYCDGSAVSRATYAALFTAISTTWGVGDGATTFNLPDMRGKTVIGDGTGTNIVSGVDADVDTATDGFTVPANNTKWITDMPVVFTLASGTITGLTSGNPYFVIRSSSTLIQLASSLANAQNGVVIDLTAKSSPVWTITQTFTARTLGESGGEEAHAISSTEQLLHTHIQNSHLHTYLATGTAGAGPGTAAPLASGTLNTSSTTAVNQNTGGNAAMNIMSPFIVAKYIISY